jgi:hypothetical protein
MPKLRHVFLTSERAGTVAMRQIFRLNLIVIFVSVLAACGADNSTISSAEKASKVTELIRTAQQCTVFKDKLASPNLDGAAIDAVYFEALKAGCIKKDI